MNRREIIRLIDEIAGEQDAFGALESRLRGLSKERLGALLLECGVIPERFTHDSTQEKLWAKCCDILLSMALNLLGIQSAVLRTRGEAADVFGETPDYSIVGDAKAFRLSRTAKNQKDFKVTALDDWRKGSTFACLVAPHVSVSRQKQPNLCAGDRQKRNAPVLYSFEVPVRSPARRVFAASMGSWTRTCAIERCSKILGTGG